MVRIAGREEHCFYYKIHPAEYKTAMSDKRSTPRFATSPGTYVVYIEGSGAIQDLSLGGAFILDSQPLEVGDRIRLDLRLGGVSIPVQGVVRRSVPGKGMGIEFEDLTADAQRRLKLYISRLASSEAPKHT